MRVVQVPRYGGPEVLEIHDVPDPRPGAGELLVDVAVAEVLFVDTQVRTGWGQDFFGHRPPYVPGTGVAGVVTAAGPGPDTARVGRRVVARTGNVGGYAERVAVPAADTFDVPDGLDPEVAVTALHDGPTALGFLDLAGLGPGQHVLVTAAGGSLGAWFVPLARAAGAEVVAAAGSAAKRAVAADRGASTTVDYTADGWTDRVRVATGGAGVDVVFDGSGGRIGREAFGVTARGGRFFSYGAASGDFATVTAEEAAARGVELVAITDGPSPTQIAGLPARALEHLAAGRVRPVLGARFPLERAADAHAAIEDRAVVGKTLLTVRA